MRIIVFLLLSLLVFISAGCQTAQNIPSSTTLASATTTSPATSTTTTTIAKETTFGDLTLGMTTAQVKTAWGNPDSTDTSGAATYYYWTTQEGSTQRDTRATTFLNSTGKLILIGQSRVGDSLLGINFLDLSGEVTTKFGAPESKTTFTSYPSGELWVYNSKNIAFAISFTGTWLNKVVVLYVLDGTKYIY